VASRGTVNRSGLGEIAGYGRDAKGFAGAGIEKPPPI
jgi:hypothetical protein